jgi:hypothetical protein
VKNDFEIRGDITAIFINSPKYGLIETIISTNDLERAQEFGGTWRVSLNNCTQTFYVLGHNARGHNGKQSTVNLHRWILGLNDPKKYVDHVNRNTLDNTRTNLNVVTPAENQQNKRMLKNNSSGHTGVSWHKLRGKWCARIVVNDRGLHLGLFDDINDAIAARKDAENKYYEYKRRLNNE